MHNVIFNQIKNLFVIPNIRKKREDEGFVLVMNDNLEIFIFNNTAQNILSLINGEKTIIQLKNELMEMYDVQETVLIDDLIEITRDLQWKKLIYLSIRAKKER